MTEKLKPCPFCGSKLVSYSRGNIRAPFLFFKCGNFDCGAVVSFDNDVCNIFPEKAIDKWNMRPFKNEEIFGKDLNNTEEARR